MTVLPRSDLRALAAVCACAIGGFLYGTFTGSGARLPVAPQLHGTVREYGEIVTRNLLVCAALIAASRLRVLRLRWSKAVVDALAAIVIVPAAWIAGLIASHPGGPALMVHAPLELAAVTLACSWTWSTPTPPRSRVAVGQRLVIVSAMLVVAAGLEVFATPHARDAHSFALGAPGPEHLQGTSQRCDLHKSANGGFIVSARGSSTPCTRRGQSAFVTERRGG